MATYNPQQLEDAASAGGELGVPILGVRNDAAAAKTDTDGDFSMAAMDSAGRLGIADLGGSITVDGSVSAVDAGDVAHDAVDSGNPVKVGGKASTAAPTAVAAGDRVNAWFDRNGRQAVLIDSTVTVAGTLVPTPSTTAQLTTFHLVSAASTNATVVKNGVANLYGWYIYNSNAAALKVAFHNSSSAPTAGASVFFSVVIPPLSAANVLGGHGIAFSSGIGITTVTGLADSDNTAVAANDLIINLFYK